MITNSSIVKQATFDAVINYVRTYFYMSDYSIHGRYVVETYQDHNGLDVYIDIFDGEPQLLRRREGDIYKE